MGAFSVAMLSREMGVDFAAPDLVLALDSGDNPLDDRAKGITILWQTLVRPRVMAGTDRLHPSRGDHCLTQKSWDARFGDRSRIVQGSSREAGHRPGAG